MGRRVGMFSYGSGLASSMFSFRIVGSVERIAQAINLQGRLESRVAVHPSDYERVRVREIYLLTSFR